MGSGSGILTETALKAGASEVAACDVDSEAIKVLKNNGINAIQSDLFSDIEGEFDLIIFNPTYLPSDDREDVESSRATSGGEKAGPCHNRRPGPGPPGQ
mgnify:CR=1 FL=1